MYVVVLIVFFQNISEHIDNFLCVS